MGGRTINGKGWGDERRGGGRRDEIGSWGVWGVMRGGLRGEAGKERE